MKTQQRLKVLAAILLVVDILALAAIGCMVYAKRQGTVRERAAVERRICVTEEMGAAEVEEKYALAIEEAYGKISLRNPMQIQGGEIGVFLSNGEGNSCAVSMELVLLESGETIVQTGIVEPGWRVEYLTAQKELQAGEYHCLARMTLYDMRSGVEMGRMAQQVLLKVLEE